MIALIIPGSITVQSAQYCDNDNIAANNIVVHVVECIVGLKHCVRIKCRVQVLYVANNTFPESLVSIPVHRTFTNQKVNNDVI